MKSPEQNFDRLNRKVLLILALATLLPLVWVAIVLWPRSQPTPMGLEAGVRNLLLVTFDTTRADHIGCYGHARAETPNLDRMAREGVLMERCFATAPITLPSHGSILTGNQPYQHGARNNGTHYMPEEAVCLAELLSEEGFATGAVVSAFVLDSRFGLDQGFDSYDDDLAQAEQAPMFMFRETKAEDTARRAADFLKDRAMERWFLWVHFFDPHANYAPPEVFAQMCEGDGYDGEIAYADHGLGELLALLQERDMLDETLVMMTSDHGESFGEHGESTHGIFVYDATTHVPWIAMHPSLARGKRVRRVVSSVDIAPTALELLGLDVLPSMDGRSLALAMADPAADFETRPAYSEAMNPLYNHGWADLRSLRDDEYRYVRAPREELYNVMRDSRELSNLLEEDGAAADPYRTGLEVLLAGGENDMRGDDIKSMDPEARAALAALGYTWSEEDESLEGGALPDPKDRIHAWEKAQFANQLVRNEQFVEAEAALRQVLEEDPGSILSVTALVGVLIELERMDEALELVQSAVHLPGARNSTWLRLAKLEREMELEGWEEHLQIAKELDPRDPLPWVRQGDWAEKDGDSDAAIEAYRQALELDERCAKAWVGIGNTEHRRENEELALDAFEKAVEADPIALEAHYNMGVVLEELERHAQAEMAYVRALEIDERHVLSRVNLANVFERTGRSEQAVHNYRLAREHDAEDFSACFNLALVLRRMGAAEEAAELFEEASRMDPERRESFRLGAQMFRVSEQPERALALVEALLAMEEESRFPHLAQAASLCGQLGRAEPAAEYAAQAMELNSDRLQEIAEKDEHLREVLDSL